MKEKKSNKSSVKSVNMSMNELLSDQEVVNKRFGEEEENSYRDIEDVFLVVDENGVKKSKQEKDNETNKFEEYDKPTQRM